MGRRAHRSRLVFVSRLGVLACYPIFAAKGLVDSEMNPPAGGLAPSRESLLSVFHPQATPEASYRLELQLLSQGLYCYDLPLFDAEWRKRGSEVVQSHHFRRTFEDSDHPFRVFIRDDHAVIFYPDKSIWRLSPVFLKKDPSGWIIDRTQTEELIRLGKDYWVVLDRPSPYFSILSDIFDLQRTEVATKIWGYRPVRLHQPSTRD